MVTTISIQIKGYHPFFINRFITQLKENLSPYLSFEGKQAFLPAKITTFTVLRSPHVDKKSREQFERKIYKRIIRWTISTPQTANMFSIYSFIQTITKLAVGVQVKMSFSVHAANIK